MKFISQTTKNQQRQINNYFKGEDTGKSRYTSGVLFGNKSADKRTGSRGHYSPTNQDRKQYNENTKPQ